MTPVTAFSIVALAALIHASFQLGVSMVTLLSSHTTGKKMSPRRSLQLVWSFFLGTIVMTTLILASLCFIVTTVPRHGVSPLSWTVLSGLLIGVGVIVWLYYYRRGDGTSLWIPRSFATFLSKRIQSTRDRTEAFSLGLTGTLAELPFAIAPACAAALSIASLPVQLQPLGVVVYVLVASLAMVLVTILIGSGHALSSIQRWREQNRRFLQFAAGSGLVILGFYLYVNQVIAPAATVAESIK